MKKKYDNLALGVIIGLVTSFLAFIIYYFYLLSKAPTIGLDDAWFYITKRGNTFTPVLIFAGSNLAFFYFFLNRKIYNTARGILLFTFIMIIPIIIIKFVL
jgi:hypothetical protein